MTPALLAPVGRPQLLAAVAGRCDPQRHRDPQSHATIPARPTAPVPVKSERVTPADTPF